MACVVFRCIDAPMMLIGLADHDATTITKPGTNAHAFVPGALGRAGGGAQEGSLSRIATCESHSPGERHGVANQIPLSLVDA